MSDEDNSTTDRRTLLKLAGLAGIPLLAGNASAGTGHLGETWTGTDNLTIDVSGFNQGGLNVTSDEGFGLKASLSSSSDVTGVGIYGHTASTYGEGVWGDATASSGETIGVKGVSSSADGYGVRGENHGGGYGVYSDGDLHVQGDFTASGTKNFVQSVDTPDGPKEVAYTAVEADRAMTETTGVAELEDGRVEIELPEHFGLVTSTEEDLVVQLTPYTIDTPGLAVTERSVERIVVESVDGEGDFEFSYTVRGVREGYEDKEIVLDDE